MRLATYVPTPIVSARASLALWALPVWLLLFVIPAVTATQFLLASPAMAQDAGGDDDDAGGDAGDDDDGPGGDDDGAGGGPGDDDGAGGDDGGPADPDDPTDPTDPDDGPDPAGELPGSDDDGDNSSSNDDCFEESALRPAWLRDCGRRPERTAKPPRARTGVTAGAGTAAGGRAGRAQPEGTPDITPVPPVFALEPENALPREIVALRLSAQDVAALESRDFVVLVRSTGPLAAGELIRFAVPEGLSTQQGLALARQLVPGAIIDFNHIYRPAQAACDTLVCRQRRAIGWPQPPQQCPVETVIGIIDTTIDRSTPALVGQKVSIIDAVSKGRKRASSSHGTAIAALLVGRPDADVPGLLPRAELVAVEAFHVAPSGEDIADTFDIVSAIDMLSTRGVPVINLSFAGPNNRVLAEIVSRSISSGAILVAAAGNKGPTGPVVYPAGYESVVAVTAVGEDLRVYRGANRGQYIDFAAPGVDVQVVSATVESKFESGTSFAAPFMSAAIAAAKRARPAVSAADLVRDLQGTAADLGRPGRDPVFGWGLVQAQDVCR